MVLWLIVFSFVCFALSGVAKACADKLLFHYSTSIFQSLNSRFWNPEISWMNKWEVVNKKPKFFGSTTFLAFTTDGWHLFDTLHSTFMQLPFVACFMAYVGMDWYGAVFVICATKIETGAFFELFFKKILK